MNRNARVMGGLAMLVAAAAAGVAQAQTNFDFTSNNGGFVDVNGRWTHGSGAWTLTGQASVGTTSLTSPAITITGSGMVTGTLTHRHGFENMFDGGQIQFSTDNGNSWNTVPQDLITGATYTQTIDAGFSSPLSGQRAFSGQSTGFANSEFVTSTFTLGTGTSPFSTGVPRFFSNGQVVQIRLFSAWDSSVTGSNPNWQVTGMTVANVIPAPGAAAMLGLGGLMVGRRRR